MESHLIKPTCYICRAPCEEESPCACATNVHKKCLDGYLEETGQTTCTVCQEDFKKPCDKKPIVILGCIVLYFLFGIIGNFFEGSHYMPFSITSLCSAIVGFVVAVLLYISVRTYRVPLASF